FEKIAQLYFFDKEIKHILFSAIIDAEKHLKSSVAHRFAEKFQDQPFAYLNTSNYSSSKILEISYIISKLSKIININKNFRNNSINHYVNSYHDVPIWVIVDYMEFGDLLAFLQNLDTGLQNKVATDMVSFVSDNINTSQLFTPETMIGLLKNIREVRNICAHNNRLIGFECRANSPFYNALHTKYSIRPDDSRKNVYSIFLSLQCFLSKIEYAKLHNSIRKRVNQLTNKIGQEKVNEILLYLGFPELWNQLSKLSQ
ncbi:TPA: Abi family protein, partial [Streptococcus pyogenes]